MKNTASSRFFKVPYAENWENGVGKLAGRDWWRNRPSYLSHRFLVIAIHSLSRSKSCPERSLQSIKPVSPLNLPNSFLNVNALGAACWVLYIHALPSSSRKM